jgi:cytidylate kinase
MTITISRETGAFGTRVAHEVGKRLGWPSYDSELIQKIADELGKPSSDLKGVDERHVAWLEECLTSLIGEHYVSSSLYLKKLISTIRGLGLLGHCVIVGRGAFALLPRESTLRVRLVADRALRTANIARTRGISEHDAEEWVDQTEKERLRFIKEHFRKNPADPHESDLILNLSTLSPEEAADLILAALSVVEKQRERNGPPRTGMLSGTR